MRLGGLAPSVSFPIAAILAASVGSHPPCFTSSASSASIWFGFILDGIFSFLAVSPVSFFLDFPVDSPVSSDVGAGSFDEDAAAAAFGAGVLDLNRSGAPLDGASSSSRPAPLKGIGGGGELRLRPLAGPGVLLRPLAGLGTTMVSTGGPAGVDSALSLFAALAEGPLLLARAFAAGCAGVASAAALDELAVD